MWISEPMPVITRIISDDSGSRRRLKLAWKVPEVIQEKTVCEIARDSGGRPTSCQTAASERANEPSITAQATPPATDLDSRRPRLELTRKPRNGRRGISSSTDLPLERREGLGIQRLP